MLENLKMYYQFQSRIYDWTRWSFLFGRTSLLNGLPFPRNAELQILEIGCGTGYNLKKLAKQFPNSQLLGVDVSIEMLKICQKNVSAFKNRILCSNVAYAQAISNGKFDLILCAYSLSMMGDMSTRVLDATLRDLKSGGILAVVDFHDSSQAWFCTHMKEHHVGLEGKLGVQLQSIFKQNRLTIQRAYFGTWRYLNFFGFKT